MKFLLKTVFFAAVVVIVFSLVASKKNLLPSSLKNYTDPRALQQQLAQINVASLGPQVSAALDALITHPSRTSPVTLGLEVTNNSLNTIVDVIQRLPPDKFNQLKSTICTPASSSAAK